MEGCEVGFHYQHSPVPHKDSMKKCDKVASSGPKRTARSLNWRHRCELRKQETPGAQAFRIPQGRALCRIRHARPSPSSICTRTIIFPAACWKITETECSLRIWPQNCSSLNVASGRVIAQGLGNEDLITPAMMFAISRVASSASASTTASTGSINIAAVAVDWSAPRPFGSRPCHSTRQRGSLFPVHAPIGGGI